MPQAASGTSQIPIYLVPWLQGNIYQIAYLIMFRPHTIAWWAGHASTPPPVGTRGMGPSMYTPPNDSPKFQILSSRSLQFQHFLSFFLFFLTFNVDERSRVSKPVTTQMLCMLSLWNGEVGIFYLRSSVIIEEESYFILLNSTPPTTAKKVIIKK